MLPKCFLSALEVKQGHEMVSIASWGQGVEGTEGFTLWVGKEICGHWNFIARLKSWKASGGIRNFCPLLGQINKLF